MCGLTPGSEAMGVCTSRDKRRMAGKVRGVRLGLMVAWGWRWKCTGAAVVTVVVVDGVGGRGSLMGSDPALSDPFLVPSPPSFSAWKRERWSLEGRAACSVVEGSVGWESRA